MNFYILLIVGQLFLGLAHFSHKTFSKHSNGFLPIGLLYSGLISLFSLPIFAVLSGFDLHLDLPLFLYSLAYGVLAAASQMLIFLALGRVNMIVYSVFSKSSAILVCSAGFLFFNDKVSLGSVASILLLSVAIIIPLFEIKKKEGNGSVIYNLFICISIMLIGLFIQLVVKGFTDPENVGTERASALYFTQT